MKRKFISILLSIALLVMCIPSLPACSKTETADCVIYGNIYTADDSNKYVEAVAIKDGKFIFVGSKEGAKKYIGKNTSVETYDSNQLITPGLVDGHTHVTQLVIGMANTLGEIKSGADKNGCRAQIQAYIIAHPELEFYAFRGWGIGNFSDEEYGCPTADMLDNISFGESVEAKPILALSRDGNSCWVNNTLMNLVSVDDSDGVVVDGEGNPVGCFNGTAKNLFNSYIQDIEDSEFAEIGLADKVACRAEIQAYVTANDLDFYTFTGWEMQNFSNEEYGCPTADMLDDIYFGKDEHDNIILKPILALSSDGHSYWVNNTLMNLAGVTRETESQDGGEIVVDNDGNPLGIFKDTAEYIIDNVRPDKSKMVYVSGIRQADQMCIGEGYVYRFDALSNMAFNSWKYPVISNMEELDKLGELKTYTQGSFVINNVDDAFELVDVAINLKETTKGGNFELTTIKIFLDGIIENEGAYLSEPYENNANNYGSQRWKGNDALIKMGHIIAKANKAGLSVHFHGMGDQAVSDILTAIEYAANEVGKDVVRSQRNAIAHLALVKESDYARFADLNVVAVFNPWCNKDPGYYELQVEYLGEERAESQYPMQSLIDAGIHYAFGTDLGASFTYNSVECFHALTTRLYKNDDITTLLKEEEKLSREEALKAMTIGAAYEMKKEDIFGSITVGKDASLCLFSKNLLTIPDNEIMSTTVINSMYQGNWLKIINE